MTDLRDRLQQAVGDVYRIERELGGGGMSRVFLAEEVQLERTVVIKVLPPETAAGVNADRFQREIQLAAKLQHPHIVPLLAAGSAGDLLYYVMPFIEGESLRSRLERDRELPIDEAVRILEDVLDALSYAHEQGIVHRDIKPDNVLLTGRHAVVSDFGVARAVTSATGASTLTSIGVALGTPAYMAPEQAAADPHVDHRADLYAFGAMAYEVLTGRPPFTGSNVQAILSAHVVRTPDPVTAHRDTVPSDLADLVMRCLAKKPADRPQRAADLIARLTALRTPAGGSTPPETRPVSRLDYAAAARRAHPLRVGAFFVLGAIGVLVVAWGLVLTLGLPDWVFVAAIGLVVVGLPITLLTGRQERRRALAKATDVYRETPTGTRPLLTWKRAFTAWATAFIGLAVLAGAAMALRALGVGPFATLLTSGALTDRQTIILDDFVNHAADSTLGPTLTEAFRVDLSQSPTVQLMDPQAIVRTLERMRRPADTRLTPEVAREVAAREGIKAMVRGQIDPVGSGYVLSAAVEEVAGGHVLAAVRATAADETHLIGAINDLSRDLRERIGESLVTIRRTQPLEQVTTASLDALRRYTEGDRRLDAGDYDGAAGLFREAIAQDSSFAMAYRKLAVDLWITGGSVAQVTTASTRAYQLRDRLPPIERDLATAWYHERVDYEPDLAASTYRSVLDRDPGNDVALINLSTLRLGEGDYAGAEALARRAVELTHLDPAYLDVAAALAFQGRYAEADSVAAVGAARSPDNPSFRWLRAWLASARGEYPVAERLAEAGIATSGASPWEIAWGETLLASLALTHGRLEAAASHARAAASAQGAPATALVMTSIFEASPRVLYLADTTTARRLLQAGLTRQPLSGMPAVDRPYSDLAVAWAHAGRPDEARRLLAEYEREVPEGMRKADGTLSEAEGAIASAEGQWRDAIAAYRRLKPRTPGCPSCGHFEIAQAFDHLGQTDSALAEYVAATTTPGPDRLLGAGYAFAPAYLRIGEIYETRDDRANAIAWYQKFVDLWQDADPELQPMVQSVHARIERLAGEHGADQPS